MVFVSHPQRPLRLFMPRLSVKIMSRKRANNGCSTRGIGRVCYTFLEGGSVVQVEIARDILNKLVRDILNEVVSSVVGEVLMNYWRRCPRAWHHLTDVGVEGDERDAATVGGKYLFLSIDHSAHSKA